MKESQYKKTLVKLLTSVEDPKKMYQFLEALLTPQEFIELAKRWQIVQQLKAGIPQRTVAKDLHVGIGTVTRGARALQSTSDGFTPFLKLSS